MKRILFLLAFLPTILNAQPYIYNTGSNQQLINHSSFYDFKTGLKVPRLDSGRWYPGYYSDIFVSKLDSSLQFYDQRTGFASNINAIEIVTPQMFGAKGDGITDDAPAFQRAINFCLINPARPKTLYIPIAKGGQYILNSALVINVRDTTVSYNPARFSIIGEQGKGGRQGHTVGVTLYRTGARGSIIRICEESDGAFPGGGKDSVVNPLNFMRSVNISGLNFVGYGADSANIITGISGRSVDNSVIENCGFAGLNFGIRLGTGLENVANEVTTIGNVTLDYCERNLIQRCSFGYVRKHIYITAPDISTITQCFFSGLINTDGSDYVLYWAAGNDYLTFSKNIVHPRTSAFPTSPVDRVIRCYSTRGALFEENHFEGLSKKLFDLAITEDIEVRNNLIQGTTISGYEVDNVFNISSKEYGRINIHDNNIALPTITDVFVKVAAINDDGSNTKLKTINLNFRPNKAVTALGGSTPLALTSNLDALYIENGQAFNPQRIGRNYIFSDDTGHILTKVIASGKPTSNTDGNIIWNEGYTTFNDGGTSGNDNQRHILHPLGAHYASLLPDQTGCIVLKHAYIESALLNADLRVQMYNSSTSQRNIKGNVNINLTAWLTSGAFATVGATIKGNGAFFLNKVRIAKDASGNFCIIIGDTTTLWSTSYVRAWIENLSVGRAGANNSWDSGWTTSIETSLSTYTEITDPQPIIETQSYSTTSIIDISSVPANSQLAAPFTLTVMGASVGDCVVVAAPNTTGIIYKGIVTSTNLVTVYACNFTTSAVDPASVTFKVTVFK